MPTVLQLLLLHKDTHNFSSVFGTRFKDLFHLEIGFQLPQEYRVWLLQLWENYEILLVCSFHVCFHLHLPVICYCRSCCILKHPWWRMFKSCVFYLFPTKTRSLNFRRLTEPLKVKFFAERPLQYVQTLKAHCITIRESLSLSQEPSLLRRFQIVSCRNCPFTENEKTIVDIKRPKMSVPLRTRLVFSILKQIWALETLHCGSNVLLLWRVKQPWIHWAVSTPEKWSRDLFS